MKRSTKHYPHLCGCVQHQHLGPLCKLTFPSPIEGEGKGLG